MQAAKVSLEEFAGIVGEGNARPAAAGDEIDGVAPEFVVEPGSVEEVSAVMKLAHDNGLKVAPRGGGTKLDLGNPPQAVDLVVSTARLNRVTEHAAGDLVVLAQAGVRLEDLQEQLAAESQALALDPPEAGATLGGLISADSSGPRRFRYGKVRDLLIGITVVLGDGTISRAGGKVVKNVAGYDLCKLYTGALGTLGIVVETIWRLHPIPEARATVALSVESPESAGSAIQSVLHSALVPSAVELEWGEGSGTLVVLLEGVEPGVKAQAGITRSLLEPHGTVNVLADEEEQELWARILSPQHESAGANGDASAEVRVRVSGVAAAVGEYLAAIGRAAVGSGLTARASGPAGSGVLHVEFSGPVESSEEEYLAAARRAVQELRASVAGHPAGGSVVLERAPESLKRQIEVWGSVGGELAVMQRMKKRFDPEFVMNPGRFVGGI